MRLLGSESDLDGIAALHAGGSVETGNESRMARLRLGLENLDRREVDVARDLEHLLRHDRRGVDVDVDELLRSERLADEHGAAQARDRGVSPGRERS